MTLDAYFRIGVRVDLGSYTFDADSIKAFARNYDPQPFHLDEEAARGSVFGALCASGWQTAAAWMKCNLQSQAASKARWDGPGPAPEFGPSPGFSNLKWLKPVYAGETVTYIGTSVSHRPVRSRPGWRLLSGKAEGFDSSGDKVIEFDTMVMVMVKVEA